MKDRLFVNEQEVPQPGTPPDTDGEYGEDSDASDDNEKEDARPPPATATGPKRLRTRYAGCINCKEEFDVSTNTKTSCSYHSGMYSTNLPDLAPYLDRLDLDIITNFTSTSRAGL